MKWEPEKVSELQKISIKETMRSGFLEYEREHALVVPRLGYREVITNVLVFENDTLQLIMVVVVVVEKLSWNLRVLVDVLRYFSIFFGRE